MLDGPWEGLGMARSPQSEVTRILGELGERRIDSREAMDQLYPLVYDELRRMAGRLMQGQAGHTLAPTALVHEAYVKLVRQPDPSYNDRAHFLSVSARAMRHILVNWARDRSAAKRGGGQHKVTLDERVGDSAGGPHAGDLHDVLALDTALDALGQENERMARGVELRVFAGMTVPEIAATLQVSERTVKSDWQFAKLWLLEAMEHSPRKGSEPGLA